VNIINVHICTHYHAELAKRAAFNLHKDSSHAFALYKKRPQRVKVKRSADAAAQSALLAGYRFDHSDAHVKVVARELVKNIPTYEEEIQVRAVCCV
jgi:hypothetical protein